MLPEDYKRVHSQDHAPQAWGMPKHAKIMIAFGGVLILCGFLGWASTGFEARAKTAILSGSVCGMLMIISGWLSGRPNPGNARIGFNIGVILSALFSGVFTWRGVVGWTAYAAGQPKFFTASLISGMAISSVTVLVLLVSMRKNNPALRSNGIV